MALDIPIMSKKNMSMEHGYGLYLLSLLIFGLCGIQHSRAEEGKLVLYLHIFDVL